ncbi:MAG: hypothetical protein LBU66_07000, partial [Treponema sp.]|nr:hypothetical protein [Treponema sp.]
MIKNLRLRLKTKMGQRPLFMQILFVIIAFTLMVVTSYIFTSDIVRKGIISDAEEALNNTQQKIAADIQESVTTINIITQTIRDMIIHVNDFEMIKGYMGNLAIGIKNNNDMHLTGLTSIFGIFDIYGGTGFNSLGFEETAAYPHEDRPWYIAAAFAGNNVVITKPYTDYMTNKTVITYVKNMFDNDNNRLGIICIDVSFERIMEYAINTNFKEKGYGLIVDSDIAVIAHPAREFIGTELNDPNGRFVKIGNELYTKKNITEYKFTNYSGNASIAFFRLIENDWFLGVITPINSYYRNVRIMGLFLTTLGLLMTLGISVILIKINNARKMSENRTKAMFNAMPMCANFWNRQYENIDTNQESVRLFELSSRKEYLQRFHELSPEYQPDGRLSSEKAIALVDKAFNEGYCRFEWMHQKLNGEEIPCEVTLVRIEYEGDYVVTGWTRDLREHLALLAEMQRAHIAEASNKAKTSFLAKVSHEVRTPLNAILGITEIQMQNQKLPDETQDALEKIYDSGYLLLNIINDILDLSKIEAGMLEL